MAKQPKYDGIRPDVKNANKGTERGRYMVEASLRETGAGRSILLDKDGRIIAGNKTFEAASDIGLPVRVVETDGTELVAVKRTDLDLDDDTGTARKLAYYDNRAAQVGLDWDAEQVLADLTAGVDLSAMFRQDELDGIIGDLVGASDAALDGFGDFGGASADDGFIAFKFGDYSGRVSKVVYDSFVAAYKEQQQESGEPMLDDVLRGWLGV